MTMLPTLWPIGSLYNPHRISSSFNTTHQANQQQNHHPYPSTSVDPRPHVNIAIINSVFLALLDTGASVSLIDGQIIDNLVQQGHKFQSSKSTVFIQDCHSSVQESLGCYLIPFTILPLNMNKSKLNGVFKFHKVKNLSSSVLLGYDFMTKYGCQIKASHWPPISFMPYEAYLVSSSMKTIFAQGCHNVGAFNKDQSQLNSYILSKTYALCPCDSASVNPADSQVIKFKISTDNDTMLKPGCSMVVSSPDLTVDNCLQTIPQVTNVLNNNMLSLRVFNTTPFVKILSPEVPIEGFKAQPLSIFKTPLQVNKEDIMIMAQINDAFDQACHHDPSFINAYISSAKEFNIIPNANTDSQKVDDHHIFNFMKKTYTLACSTLRATGKPPPGVRDMPKTPCPEDKKHILLEQVSLDHLEDKYKALFQKMLLDNHDVFSKDRFDLGRVQHFEHVINPIDPAKPPPFTKQFRIPLRDQMELDQIATNLEAAGVIMPQSSQGNSPVFLVRKPGNPKPRWVQDFRAQNVQCFPDRYNISDIRESIIKAGELNPQYFSSCDLTGAFHQLSLAEESRPWSAFTLPFRGQQFVWTVTAMGLRGASSSFSRLIHHIFNKMPKVICYIDDILVISSTLEEMLQLMYDICAELRYHGLKANPQKLFLALKKIKYLGYQLSNEGITPDDAKLDKLRALEPPKSAKEIESVLPFLQFNSQCIEHFQILAAPLAELTKQTSKWKSTTRHGDLPPAALEAFLQIKAMLLEKPLVAFPNTSLPFCMFADATLGTTDNPGGIGAVLTQNFNGVTKPIGYYSRRLRNHELRYTIFNCEMAAVVYALEHWQPLLKGSDLVIFTDHLPLQKHSTRDAKTMSQLLQKILLFDCKITHLMGADNRVADYLSRSLVDAPNELSDKEFNKQQLLQHPETKNQSDNKSADRNVNNLSQNLQNFEISEKTDKVCLPTISVGQSADNSAVCPDSPLQPDKIKTNKQCRAKMNNQNNQTEQNLPFDFSKSKPIIQDDPTVPDAVRQALIAKHQRSMGLMGSLRRFKAKNICESLQSLDINCMKVWQTEQGKDPLLQAIIKKLTLNQLPREGSKLRPIVQSLSPRCFLDDKALLYYFGNNKNKFISKKLLVPKTLVLPVLSESHGSSISGHWAEEITINKLLASYFWPSMVADVHNFIQRCPTCYIQQDKTGLRSRTKITPLSTPTHPNHRVHADLVGPLRSVTEHHWVLSITDALTKYTVLVPLKTKEAQEVAQAIVNHWILIFGPFQILMTDMGAEFTANITKSIMEYFRIKTKTTSSYHPSANGQAERVHRSMANYLTTYSNTLGTDWCQFLPSLQYSLNTKVHSSTGFSPHFLMFGVHPHQPWRTSPTRPNYSENEAIQRLNLIEFAIKMVKDNDHEAKAAFQKAYNKSKKAKTFNVGDFVLVHFPPGTGLTGANKKFTANWRGVYRIRRQLGPTTFLVGKSHGRSTKVPADRLKSFNSYIHLDNTEVMITPGDDTDVIDQFEDQDS